MQPESSESEAVATRVQARQACRTRGEARRARHNPRSESDLGTSAHDYMRSLRHSRGPPVGELGRLPPPQVRKLIQRAEHRLTHGDPCQLRQGRGDGRQHDIGVVDLYSRTMRCRVAKSFSGLAPGSHTVTVQTLGTKNASSIGTRVVVDGFVVGQWTRRRGEQLTVRTGA